jgi:hypothetical protein
MKSVVLSLLALASSGAAHYTFPELLVGGKGNGNWVNVRQTANYQSNGTQLPSIPQLLPNHANTT